MTVIIYIVGLRYCQSSRVIAYCCRQSLEPQLTLCVVSNMIFTFPSSFCFLLQNSTKTDFIFQTALPHMGKCISHLCDTLYIPLDVTNLLWTAHSTGQSGSPHKYKMPYGYKHTASHNWNVLIIQLEIYLDVINLINF